MRWRTAVEMFRERVARSGNRTALRHKDLHVWRSLTWHDWDIAAREIAAGLRTLGVKNGDRVCVLANTRYEWVEADVGILMAGGVTVPIYQSNTPKECEYIINDCQAHVIIVEDDVQLSKLVHPDVRPKLGHVTRIVVMNDAIPAELHHEAPEGTGWACSLVDLRAAGRAWLAKHAGELEKAWDAITPQHVFTIVYTSGTTGPPKGVVLTHENICFECEVGLRALTITEDDEQLIFLPLAHIFAKLLEWTSIASGSRMAFAEGIPKITENLREVRPTCMGAVPRVYEKAFVKIQQTFETKRRRRVAGALIDGALAIGRHRSRKLIAGRRLNLVEQAAAHLADRVVFAKVKESFGGRIRFFVSGGAPLAQSIAEFFHSLGITILEGYGMTETTAATHINRLNAYRFGTVGPAADGVDVMLAQDGEVLVRGKNIMREYFGRPADTKEAIDEKGWLHTGDIGVIEDGGFLRITDRKKDIIVTAGGKNIAPQNIESALKASCPYVSQVVVHGDKRNFLSALVTLNEENIVAWARERQIAFKDFADLTAHRDVVALVHKAVNDLNATLASYETIKKFKILPRDLTQEAGEMTPTLKVKRKTIGEKYCELFDQFYPG